MTTWLYRTIRIAAKGSFLGGNVDESEIDRVLNDMGRQGWELVAAVGTNKGFGESRCVLYTFKRPGDSR